MPNTLNLTPETNPGYVTTYHVTSSRTTIYSSLGQDERVGAPNSLFYSFYNSISPMATPYTLPGSERTQPLSYDSNDLRIVVWTELRVPRGQELDEQRWAGYFQPLVHATGHDQSVWARLRNNPEAVILATCKSYLQSDSCPEWNQFADMALISRLVYYIRMQGL